MILVMMEVFPMTCDFASGDMCLNEVCTYDYSSTDDDSDTTMYLDCNVCITDSGDTIEYNEFCMETLCNMNTYLAGGTTEDACTCEYVSIDGVQCDSCSFCSSDGIDYDMESSLSQGNEASLTNGLELQCSRAEEYSTSCSATAKATYASSARASPTITGVIGIGLAVLGGAVALFVLKKTKKDEDPKTFSLVEEQNGHNGVYA
jgi:hypothetical protein